jgi:hypothetical protein
MTHRLAVRLLLLSVLALALPAIPAAADLDLRVGAYTTGIDKPFAGIGFLSHAGHRLYLNPNVEYVFVDDGHFGTGNFDLHIDLPTDGHPYVWVGGGLALVYRDAPGPGGTSTKPRANILGGLGFPTGGSIVYTQVKYITQEGYWVFAGGIRF